MRGEAGRLRALTTAPLVRGVALSQQRGQHAPELPVVERVASSRVRARLDSARFLSLEPKLLQLSQIWSQIYLQTWPVLDHHHHL